MTAHPIVAPKKLIEVALPLDEINKASAKEKSIRHGHPSALHLWWARRPLAAARAVLFAQLVNDPAWGYSEEELKKPQIKSAITRKRKELFTLITQLVQWENTNDEEVLSRARAAIRESWRETCQANQNHPDAKTLFNPDRLPPFQDPFAGGGSIPLEAQRLGLEAHATDLNPVAVLINKAMIEIPPKFAGRSPIGPLPPGEKQTKAKGTEDWSGTRGLAEDVRRYGSWMFNEAKRRLGHLYPQVRVSKEMLKDRPDLQGLEGQRLDVIAWIWARTVVSPNPAAGGVHVPLISSLCISSAREPQIWVNLIHKKGEVSFKITSGKVNDAPDSTVGRNGGYCFITKTTIPLSYIRAEGQAGRIGQALIAIVADAGTRGRVYLSPDKDHERIARELPEPVVPASGLPEKALGFRVQEYGIHKYRELFSRRQLTTLSQFSQLVEEVRTKVEKTMGKEDHGYAIAVATYLALGASKLADYNSTLTSWSASRDQSAHVFTRQALPMVWDFTEVNPFAEAAGNIEITLTSIARALERLPAKVPGVASQMPAQNATQPSVCFISTDPPYYDNVGYADLSDFFYFWLRQSLRNTYPDLCSTMMTPKAEELVAEPYRHNGKVAAERFFLEGMGAVMTLLGNKTTSTGPLSIYYAFKQADTQEDEGTASTGWETFLDAIISSGLMITGTWPMRSERGVRMRAIGSNALASSIILICRPRSVPARTASRREFIKELEHDMPPALEEMIQDTSASIAPVDLAQASIGPGMAIFSKYKSVLEADGSPMSVHSALIHINKAIDDYFAHAEGDMDADTRFCIGWFQQHEFEEGPFGEADVLARAKGTSVDGVRDAGVIRASKGKVRLLRVKDYPDAWDPTIDSRLPIWEACHQMCRALGESESEAGALLARMPDKQDSIRQLAYRLYTICERKGWAEDARAYNELVTSWPAIVEESLKTGHKGSQMSLL